jgi:hypothetical protein
MVSNISTLNRVPPLLGQLEGILEYFLSNANLPLLFEGKVLEASDAASSRGLLPMILEYMKYRFSFIRDVLNQEEYNFIFGWLDQFYIEDDTMTLTGRKVMCKQDIDCIFRYSIAAALCVTIDELIDNAPSHGINFDQLNGEALYGKSRLEL